MPATTTRRRLSSSVDLHASLQQLADRAVAGRRNHDLVLGVHTNGRPSDVRVAAGDVDAEAPYYIASISKMFTAALVLQLVDEGHLRLDDRVVPLLGDYDLAGLHVHRDVDATEQLEVHHLLHQTSGLGDYFNDNVEDQLAAGNDRSYSIQDTIDVARMVGAAFPPGDRNGRRSLYSDTNYQLLTAIVETVVGDDYAAAVAQRIVEPLGLDDTYVVSDAVARPAPLQLWSCEAQLAIPDALASERGAGGIVSTLADQLRFSRAFHDGELFHGGTRRAAPGWNRVQNFTLAYGYGMMRYRLPRWMTGRRLPEMFGHSGSTASFLFYVPDLDCHLAGTFNQFADPSRPFRLLPRVAGVVAADQR